MGEPKCAWAFGSSLRNSSAKDCPAPACVQGDFGLAAGTDSKVISDEENADLAVIEAKLADEMIGLGNFLKAFALRTKAIREEIPDSAQFCKLVAGFSLSWLSSSQRRFCARSIASRSRMTALCISSSLV